MGANQFEWYRGLGEFVSNTVVKSVFETFELFIKKKVSGRKRLSCEETKSYENNEKPKGKQEEKIMRKV